MRDGQGQGILEGVTATGLRLVGMLGGIGSGKSTAARFLAEAAAGFVLDADRVVGELFEDPQVLAELELAAGAVLRGADGTLQRAVLAERIFQDASARQRVEAVLHPRVRARHWEELERLERAHPGALVVLDIPLLLEGGLDAICDFLVFVEVAAAARAGRARLRHGWTEEAWAAREAAQLPVQEKRARADAILRNDAGTEQLRAACAGLADRLRSLPSRPLRERWSAPEEAPRRAGNR